ncbi:MAG: protein kinase domain-containing protein [Planctomycetota bacterium]|jgi:serine/threonine-protein kinase
MSGPVDNSQDSALEEALQQFVNSHLRGEEPDVDEFVARYPEFEDQLRKRIGKLRRIDTLLDSLVETDESDFADTATSPDLAGQKIGSFEIGEVIGRGGMGVVYLARDTKLDRSVAIKSMPAELQADSTAQMRFKREARLLASLNHPNIAVIHDIIEQDDNSGYLVLEYVPGQTLAERIAHRPLKLEDALSIGRQIAEALLGAYEQGVTHRDLKPGNIKITPEGRVKVLDFGLAKASETQDDKTDKTITQPGRIVGTPAYMSPEQARGNPTDHRTDIWSFGCVMYEMLTGRLPFEGETATDTVARVLERQPDWQALPRQTPANIRVMLRRCLEKKPRQRLQHIGDAVLEINETLNLPGAVPPVTTSSGSISPATDKRLLMGVIAACLVLVAMAASLTTWILKPSASPLSPPSVRFPITLPRSQQAAYSSPLLGKLALSPDGVRIAYIASENGVNHLFVRELDSEEARRISGTEDAHSPFFSPDGNWVAFFTEGRLKKVSLETGTVLDICFVSPVSHGGCWVGIDDTIYFTRGPSSGLSKVSAEGESAPILATDPNHADGQMLHTLPTVLPGEKDILFTIATSESLDKWRIALLSVETNNWRQLSLRGSNAHYVECGGAGYLVYAGLDSLLAVPFDLKHRRVTGSEVKVIEGVLTGTSAPFGLSANGTLVYASEGIEISKSILVWVDFQGKKEPLSLAPDTYAGPRLSPDGRQLAVIKVPTSATSDIFIGQLARPALTKITDNPGWDLWPVWGPVSMRITYGSARVDNNHIPSLFSVSADGSGEEPLVEGNPKEGCLPCSWSGDEQKLAFVSTSTDANEISSFDIGVLSMADGRQTRKFLATRYNEKMPAFHPGGDWIAYASDSSGQYEVYIRRYPSGEDRKQISFDRGDEPVWDPSGKMLYYRSGNTMKAVAIEIEPSFSIGEPNDLFIEWAERNNMVRNYDFDPVHRRFIMVKPLQDESAPMQINVVLNWFEELKRLVPSKKDH